MKIGKLEKTYRVESGKHFRLKDFDPADTGDCPSKEYAEKALLEGVARTAELQEMLYAQDNWAVLLIFQAMDAAGKDGAIAHVMSGVNPQGCQVFSFKHPSATELQHDFLWRTTRDLPERGRIGIFNPIVLRGGANRPRPPRHPPQRGSWGWSARRKDRLAEPISLHRGFGTTSAPQRDADRQILSPPVERRAAGALFPQN